MKYSNLLFLITNKRYFLISLIITLFHLSLYASPEFKNDCSNVDFESSKPDFAETEAEKVARLEGELMSALNQFDSCLEIMERAQSISSSTQSNQSGSAEGNEKDTKKAEPSTVQSVAKYDVTKDSEIDELSGDNGAVPKDIPDDSTDDVVAAQYKREAKAEKNPELKKIRWDMYREYKGIKK